MLLGDEADDVSLRQFLERLVDLRLGHSAFVGNEGLVNESVVDEQSAVVAQQGGDDSFFVGRCLLELVKLVSAEQEHYPCLVLLFLDILDIPRTVEYLQGRVYLNGEMVELVTEVVDTELEGGVITGAGGYLIVICQMVVDFAYVVFLREGVADTLL